MGRPHPGGLRVGGYDGTAVVYAACTMQITAWSWGGRGQLPLFTSLCKLTRRSPLPAGQTGLGKSTLINTIFASHLIDTKGRFEADEPIRQTTEIQAVSHSASSSPRPTTCTDKTFVPVVQENNVKLRLNIVDTPGYGDLVNNDGW